MLHKPLAEAMKRPKGGAHDSQARIGTRKGGESGSRWLAKLEAEHAELGQRVTEPPAPVHSGGQRAPVRHRARAKTLAELFDGRSQLLTLATHPTRRSVIGRRRKEGRWDSP
jgi:hypothetical protein